MGYFPTLLSANKNYFEGNFRRKKILPGKKVAKFRDKLWQMTSNDTFRENLTFASDYFKSLNFFNF